MVFYEFLWWYFQVYNELREYEKKSNFKYLRAWNLCPKLELVITFWAVLLVISFEDFTLIFYIWVPDTTIKGGIKTI